MVVKARTRDYEIFINEINILRELDHPNVLNVHEIWETEEICSIVSEYLPGGDLLNFFNNQVKPLPQLAVNKISR